MSIAGLYRFYRDGLRSMTVCLTLWKIILDKLFVMFAIINPLFFQVYLCINFSTAEERAGHVLERITGPGAKPH